MQPDTPEGWAELSGAALVIEGKRLRLPGLTLSAEVGRGMNAVVFQAVENKLKRPVAVKVWNARGTSRAQLETAKIAQLNHPFILTVHRFGVVQGHPYAVMELVSGVTGKQWLESPRTVDHRLGVWRMYADTLAFIYSQGVVHGDAHLGNVLIFDDPDRRFGRLTPAGSPFALKVADMGTSAFWRVHAEFGAREADIIIETLSRLFPDRGLRLDRLKPGFSHQDSLALMDRVADYLRYMQGGGQPDRRSLYATEIVDMILETPLFDLDQVLDDTRRSGLTSADRLTRRLNARLLGLTDVMEAEPGLTDQTRRLYDAVSERFVNHLATGAPLPPRIAP